MLPPTGGGRAPAERLARLAPCIGCRPCRLAAHSRARRGGVAFDGLCMRPRGNPAPSRPAGLGRHPARLWLRRCAARHSSVCARWAPLVGRFRCGRSAAPPPAPAPLPPSGSGGRRPPRVAGSGACLRLSGAPRARCSGAGSPRGGSLRPPLRRWAARAVALGSQSLPRVPVALGLLWAPLRSPCAAPRAPFSLAPALPRRGAPLPPRSLRSRLRPAGLPCAAPRPGAVRVSLRSPRSVRPAPGLLSPSAGGGSACFAAGGFCRCSPAPAKILQLKFWVPMVSNKLVFLIRFDLFSGFNSKNIDVF